MQIETEDRIRKLRHAGIKIDMPQTINDIAVDKRRRDFINEVEQTAN
jgi:ribosomal protein L13E